MCSGILPRILSNEGCMKVLLTQQEARVVAKHLRRIMGHPVHSFIHHGPKARLVQMAGALEESCFRRGLGEPRRLPQRPKD